MWGWDCGCGGRELMMLPVQVSDMTKGADLHIIIPTTFSVLHQYF